MELTPENMSAVGAREVKNRLGAYLKQVRDGREIIVTRRDQPIARLTAVGADADRLAELIKDGTIGQAAAGHALRATTPAEGREVAGVEATGGQATAAKRPAKRTAKCS